MLQERLQQVLMQWQHPAAPLPPALLAAQSSGSTGAVAAAAAVALVAGAAAAAVAGDRSKADGAAVLLRERAQQWREALRGAYVALRHGHCPLVYVCGQVGFEACTSVSASVSLVASWDSCVCACQQKLVFSADCLQVQYCLQYACTCARHLESSELSSLALLRVCLSPRCSHSFGLGFQAAFHCSTMRTRRHGTLQQQQQ